MLYLNKTGKGSGRMEKKQERRRTGKEKETGSWAALLALLMFWGLLYPQFALTKDTYRVLQEEESREQDSLGDYGKLLTAGPGEVRIRIGLLDEIEKWFGEKETYE